ncbi:hypothetical protein IFM89_037771 [Coptis chinensis]|uniref:Uncharacterized protein n=1 Tax=Coptis chinensis TaxID=261450 RepID=A0A835ISS1_9MAGN|nr:hypothetical protein IFM89_037771 [Coptis chinensis]
MNQIIKILSILIAIAAFWIGLLETSASSTQLYMDATNLLDRVARMLRSINSWSWFDEISNMSFRSRTITKGNFIVQDVAEARDFLKQRGVDVGSD